MSLSLVADRRVPREFTLDLVGDADVFEEFGPRAAAVLGDCDDSSDITVGSRDGFDKTVSVRESRREAVR